MGPSLFIHVLAGGAGLLSGFIALYSSKGAPLHRRAGLVFVFTMLVMCGFGLLIAVVRNTAPAINVPAALLTASLVVTALTTVRPPTRVTRAVDSVAAIVCLAVGVISLRFAWEAVAAGGARNGMPAFPFFLFGFVSLIAVAGDVAHRRSGGAVGSVRIARHLWRMCFALFVAALSFFIGQADVFPEPIRVLPLLALPVVTVLVSMLYWLWRVRIRRSLRGLMQVSTVPGGVVRGSVHPARVARAEPTDWLRRWFVLRTKGSRRPAVIPCSATVCAAGSGEARTPIPRARA